MSEDNKFKKDVADPQADFDKLDKIFEVMDEVYEVSPDGELVNSSTGEIMNASDVKAEVVEMRKELKEIEESLPDVDQIILSNIERANRFLDKIEESLMAGNLSAGMMESVGTLINAVTAAATSITGISYNNDVLDIRREELRIREKKLTIENIAKGAQEVHITNNNLTMTREELLKELREAKK